MSGYPESDSNFRVKFKAELDLSNCTTENKQNMLQALIHLI